MTCARIAFAVIAPCAAALALATSACDSVLGLLGAVDANGCPYRDGTFDGCASDTDCGAGQVCTVCNTCETADAGVLDCTSDDVDEGCGGVVGCACDGAHGCAAGIVCVPSGSTGAGTCASSTAAAQERCAVVASACDVSFSRGCVDGDECNLRESGSSVTDAALLCA
ncbi:MAG TPA: hypothetical protein VGO62_17130, partial [Myxococcota bacterium]